MSIHLSAGKQYECSVLLSTILTYSTFHPWPRPDALWYNSSLEIFSRDSCVPTSNESKWKWLNNSSIFVYYHKPILPFSNGFECLVERCK